MFDMQQVGRTIGRLRREQNLTQLELADRMGVSFQAVSNWERGVSMPDISKLPELATILGVTIDEFLQSPRESRIVESILEEKPIEEPVTGSDVSELAPLLKPKQVERLFGEAADDIDIEDMQEIAPFVGEALLGRFANGFLKTHRLADLAPIANFLEEEWLEEAVKQADDVSGIEALAPFLSEEALRIAAEKTADSGLIVHLLPFLESDVIAEFALRMLEGDQPISELCKFAPFLEEEDLSRIAQLAYDKRGDVGEIASLAPFLEEEALSEIAAKILRQHGLKAIRPLLPFLDTDLLDEQMSRD